MISENRKIVFDVVHSGAYFAHKLFKFKMLKKI